MTKMVLSVLALLTLFAVSYQNVSADSHEKTDFASSLEETLGHFWALEQNLNDGNAKLALVHATHPIAELYDSMKPTLKTADPSLDSKIQATLTDLKDKATTKVSRERAQQAIDEAKEIVETARTIIVGDELSQDPIFKVKLMKVLLATSVAEYSEAVSDGAITEMAEFQDGSAFVWRSQEIFKTIRDDIDKHTAKMDASYKDLWVAYDSRADPSSVKTIVAGITYELDEILGVEHEDENLLEYVENIRTLLTQTKMEYDGGSKDVALSLATKAYLDNFEFLEAPLIEMDNKDLVVEVEIMLREDLRDLIKNGAPSEEVVAKADAILEKMDIVEATIPEFGPIAIVILATAIVGIVAVTSKSRLSLRV